MPIDAQFFARQQAILAMHAELMRAIHAGSPKIFNEFRLQQSDMGRAIAFNDVNPENPDAQKMLIKSEVELKARQGRMTLESSWSVSSEKLEDCGVAFTIHRHDQKTWEHLMTLDILGSLTPENEHIYTVGVTGIAAEKFVQEVSAAGTNRIEKTKALLLIKDMALENDKYF